MLKRQVRTREAWICAGDLAFTIAAFVLAHKLSHMLQATPETVPFLGRDHDFWLLAFILPVWWLLLHLRMNRRPWGLEPFRRAIWPIISVAVFGGGALFAFLYVGEFEEIPKAMVYMFLGADALLRIGFRLVLRWATLRAYRNGDKGQNILIVGTGPRAQYLASCIERHRQHGLHLLGFISETEGATPLPHNVLLGTVKDVPQILRKQIVDGVAVAVELDLVPQMAELFLYCERIGINAYLASDIFPHEIAKVQFTPFEGIPLLNFTTIPHDPTALVVKRAMDIVGALIVLLLCSWVYLLAAVLIKATSRGPVFFRQKRIGLHGRTFDFFKFRTMIVDAEEKKAELSGQNMMDGPVFKIMRDPRVTPIGRLLRKFSIDELPQIWNVCKGEMSLVGPRPPLPSEVEKYDIWHLRRLSVRPGLTCLWQVSGRNRIGFDEWMRLDLKYIDTWSLWLDLKILFKTVFVVLGGRGI